MDGSRHGRIVLALGAGVLWGCGPSSPPVDTRPGAGPGWPAYADVPHTICMSENNTHRCARQVERHQLRLRPPGLSRRDSVFRIVLTSGDTARIVDERDPGPGGTDDRLHAYLGYHAGVRQHLIGVTLWESGHYLLVDPHHGERHVVHALPVVSPDSTRFAVASSSLDYGSTGSLQIWRIGEGGIERTWEAELPEADSPTRGVTRPPRWSPGDAFWLDDEELCVRIDVPPDEAGRPRDSEPAGWVVLREADGRWTFDPHPRTLAGGDGEATSECRGRDSNPQGPKPSRF